MPQKSSSRVVRELCVFGAFCALTVLMTWPWAAHLRDAVSDAGDPYLNAWTLWWDFHQTFRDPLHLFDANIFYPLKDTLAFSEHEWGLALPFFPLFAIGVRPLTVVGIATLLAFAFSGYGAFRLTRTLTGSTAAAWVAGIGFAFTPYRFHQISHVDYAFAGWIPLLFEALVLFVRGRTWRRAAWLGACFLMNGLVAIHWLVLTSIPFAVVALFLLWRERAWRDPALLRGASALGLACLGLLPFLLPYQRAARSYGFTRNATEARFYSATPQDWLEPDQHNRLWSRADRPPASERGLFPGAGMPALGLVALGFAWTSRPRRRDRVDAASIGGALFVLGFLGSLGMRFAFHRALFEHLAPFRSIRAPARWAMVGHLGLAVLAGVGVLVLVSQLSPRKRAAIAAIAGLALLFELRCAPLGIVLGAVDPDEVTRVLAKTPMRGGLVELPSNFRSHGNYEYVLRAADHRKPLVNGVSGFTPPLVLRLDGLMSERPIQEDALLDHLESIPASYLVVHESFLDPWERPALHHFLAGALSSGRLRFLGRYDGARRNDLYVVTKTEPQVPGAARPTWDDEPAAETPRLREDGGILGSVDNPADAEVVRGRLTVRGWARMPGEVIDVTVVLDGEARKPISLRRGPRPDVCKVFPKMAPCDAAGYEALFDFRPGDEGAHEILALFRAADGRARHYPVRRFQWRP